MTNNEKDAHTAAYDATRRLALTMDKEQKIYIAAKAEYDGARLEFQEAYETIYQETLAKLEAQ